MDREKTKNTEPSKFSNVHVWAKQQALSGSEQKWKKGERKKTASRPNTVQPGCFVVIVKICIDNTLYLGVITP